MSLPNFPQDLVKIEWEQALSMIVASIAMEELALSHILNAEGEKLQYVLGTLHKGQVCHASSEEVLKVNESIGNILDKVETNQILLKGKLEQAIKANKQHSKRVCTYYCAKDFFWCKEASIPWIKEDECQKNSVGCNLTKITLPTGTSSLVSYSFELEINPAARNVVVQLQRTKGSSSQIIAVEETHTCYNERVVHICGCVVAPLKTCEGDDQIEFILCSPCGVCVSNAALTITPL